MVVKLQKNNVLVLVMLFFVTYGIYAPIWFLKQKKAINGLNSKKKLNNKLLIFTLIMFIISAILFVLLIVLSFFAEESIIKKIDTISSLVTLVASFAILIVSFDVRDMLKEHFKRELSVLATLFFSIFYLQWKINKFLEGT